MIEWLQTLDLGLFKLLHLSLRNPVLDQVLPFFSDNAFFIPAAIIAIAVVVSQGSNRARICLAVLALSIALGDSFVCNTIKKAVGRVRPCEAVAEARPLLTCTASGSMPSSHAANWGAVVFVFFFYYGRKSLVVTGPLAATICLSRVYTGMHYPSDVIAGAILGAGYTATLLWTLEKLWRLLTKKYFPLWSQRLPSLLDPPGSTTTAPSTSSISDHDRLWLRSGYLLIAVLFVIRLCYLLSGKIELSEDEAYQWLWSKHLALSYYSKPPMIAYAQFLGTSLFGDNAFGVRFLSPVLAAIISILLLRFLTKEACAKAGFAVVLMVTVTPLLAVGASLMTVDPLSVAFWVASFVAGWRAVQKEGTTKQWIWVGVWMGLGCLSKYTNLFQWLCWLTFFALWKPARFHLRRPGPYLALCINALFLLPVLVWNARHGWITVEHVASDGRLDRGIDLGLATVWKAFQRYTVDFVISEAFLLNPVFFLGMIVTIVLVWRRHRSNALYLYLLAMGAPLFFAYALFTLHSRVLPNWIAPAIPSLFCLTAVYWATRWKDQRRSVRLLFNLGVTLGATVIVLLHDTNLIGKVFKRNLPPKMDPLRRVRGWQETADVISRMQLQMTNAPGVPFVIGDHYGIVGQLSFYMPNARAVAASDSPLIYFPKRDRPVNQFYFWPSYERRRGQDAIYVAQLEPPRLANDWFLRWLQKREDLYADDTVQPVAAPPDIEAQFRVVRSIGVVPVRHRDRTVRHLQLFYCRTLK